MPLYFIVYTATLLNHDVLNVREFHLQRLCIVILCVFENLTKVEVFLAPRTSINK